MSDRQKVYQFIVTVEGREGDDFDVIKFGVTSQEACGSECPPCKRDAVRKVFDAPHEDAGYCCCSLGP